MVLYVYMRKKAPGRTAASIDAKRNAYRTMCHGKTAAGLAAFQALKTNAMNIGAATCVVNCRADDVSDAKVNKSTLNLA